MRVCRQVVSMYEFAETCCKSEGMIVDETEENERFSLLTDSVLLPGLPDHLAHLCLSNLRPSLLSAVCRSWRRLIYSPSFPPFFSLYALLSQTSSADPNSIGLACFDPISSKWRALPSPPLDPHSRILRRHPSFISRILSVQSLTVSGRLVLLAATSQDFLPALNHPFVFDPSSGHWCTGPPIPSPRRWCVTGSINGSVYVASGTGAQYHSEVARSTERWDMWKKEAEWNWEKRAPFKDGRFCREAIDALGYRGKLFMVNVKGKAPKEGAVYDVVMDGWEEMPRGMLDGWNGPATVDDYDDVLYVVDQENGSIGKYIVDEDRWEEVIKSSEHLKGAEHLSACRGKICAVLGDGGKIIVVDIVARPVKFWTVHPPQGMEVVSVHILPRMSDR